jgi:hypothetical protein
MTAREKEAALTATITEPRIRPADDNSAVQNENSRELELRRAISQTDMAAIEAIIAASKPNMFESLLFDKVTHSLRPSRKARDMTRKGGRYVIRKDHGTKAFYQEVAEANATRNTRLKNSCAARRKLSKLASRKGNEQAIAKLIRLGDLLIGD